MGVQKEMRPVITFSKGGIRTINIIPQVERSFPLFCSIRSSIQASWTRSVSPFAFCAP